MKNFVFMAVLVASVALTGCNKYAIGNWSVEPATQTARYEGEQFTGYVARHPDSTPERLHIVSEVNPNAGAVEMPRITGALTDTLSGGKRLDIYVETEKGN